MERSSQVYELKCEVSLCDEVRTGGLKREIKVEEKKILIQIKLT